MSTRNYVRNTEHRIRLHGIEMLTKLLGLLIWRNVLKKSVFITIPVNLIPSSRNTFPAMATRQCAQPRLSWPDHSLTEIFSMLNVKQMPTHLTCKLMFCSIHNLQTSFPYHFLPSTRLNLIHNTSEKVVDTRCNS
jgi:hypothetical protein